MLLQATNIPSAATKTASASASGSDSTNQSSIVNLVNSDNCTALMLAAHYNHYECVRVLLTDKSAAQRGLLLDLDTVDGNSGLTALESALAEGAHETVLLLREAQLRLEGTHTGKPLRAKL
jgi:ankyrin repeat protein